MSRVLPHPLATIGLWVVWLIMNNSVAPAQVLLGAVVGIAIPALTRAVWPDRLVLRRPAVLLRLLAIVFRDIVVANLQVARLILGPRSRLRPAFVAVPLRLTSPYAIAALAGIVTLTPGTVSAELSADRRTLFVHVLDLADEAALIALIRSRYEAPLAQIIEC